MHPLATDKLYRIDSPSNATISSAHTDNSLAPPTFTPITLTQQLALNAIHVRDAAKVISNQASAFIHNSKA